MNLSTFSFLILAVSILPEVIYSMSLAEHINAVCRKNTDVEIFAQPEEDFTCEKTEYGYEYTAINYLENYGATLAEALTQLQVKDPKMYECNSVVVTPTTVTVYCANDKKVIVTLNKNKESKLVRLNEPRPGRLEVKPGEHKEEHGKTKSGKKKKKNM